MAAERMLAKEKQKHFMHDLLMWLGQIHLIESSYSSNERLLQKLPKLFQSSGSLERHTLE